jgi:hypothetical protein
MSCPAPKTLQSDLSPPWSGFIASLAFARAEFPRCPGILISFSKSQVFLMDKFSTINCIELVLLSISCLLAARLADIRYTQRRLPRRNRTAIRNFVFITVLAFINLGFGLWLNTL